MLGYSANSLFGDPIILIGAFHAVFQTQRACSPDEAHAKLCPLPPNMVGFCTLRRADGPVVCWPVMESAKPSTDR